MLKTFSGMAFSMHSASAVESAGTRVMAGYHNDVGDQSPGSLSIEQGLQGRPAAANEDSQPKWSSSADIH